MLRIACFYAEHTSYKDQLFIRRVPLKTYSANPETSGRNLRENISR